MFYSSSHPHKCQISHPELKVIAALTFLKVSGAKPEGVLPTVGPWLIRTGAFLLVHHSELEKLLCHRSQHYFTIFSQHLFHVAFNSSFILIKLTTIGRRLRLGNRCNKRRRSQLPRYVRGSLVAWAWHRSGGVLRNPPYQLSSSSFSSLFQEKLGRLCHIQLKVGAYRSFFGHQQAMFLA